MVWDGRYAGVPLPAGFHNWPVEHTIDGTHGDITPDSLYGDVVYLGAAAAYTTLQSAITALGGPGTVYVLPGYTETVAATVVWADKVSVICPSRDAVFTIGNIVMIDHAGASNVTISGIKVVGPGSGTTSKVFARKTGGHAYNWVISDCAFDDVAYVVGIDTYAGGARMLYWVFERCYITGYIYRCFHGYNNMNRFLVKDSWVVADATNGIFYYQEYQSSGRQTDIKFHNVFMYNLIAPVYYLRISNYAGDEWVNCHLVNGTYGFGHGNAVTVLSIPKVYKNCIADNVGREGFVFRNYAKCDGCQAINCSDDSANTYAGFRILASADRTELTDIDAYDTGANTQKYGVLIDSGADKCKVTANNLSGNVTGAYLDNGTNTILDLRDD